MLVIFLLSSGCSFIPDNFDNQEFGYLAELNVAASITVSPCATDELMEINKLSSILSKYSEHTMNANTSSIYAKINSLTSELVNRTEPSNTYCNMKRKSIAEVSNEAMSVFGTRIK
tara:strand:- start:2080 stop:2427 length:348 start_codon:yes stop_codon:yes gene_type:complete